MPRTGTKRAVSLYTKPDVLVGIAAKALLASTEHDGPAKIDLHAGCSVCLLIEMASETFFGGEDGGSSHAHASPIAITAISAVGLLRALCIATTGLS